MNLFDLSAAVGDTHVMLATGGWAGTLPDGYTTMVDGKKFTVHTFDSGTQVLIHKLPDGGVVRIYKDGNISWYKDHGDLHREDGPAVIYSNGTEMWYYDGKRHREDGPAVVLGNGEEFYYLHGKRVNKEELL